jgi:hypothetical protein
MNILRFIAAILLILSGILHILQLYFHPINNSIIGTAFFGVVFLIVGLLLFVKRRAFLLVGAIVPAIGVIIGTADHFTSATPLNIFWLFLFLDIIVVPICFILYIRKEV